MSVPASLYFVCCGSFFRVPKNNSNLFILLFSRINPETNPLPFQRGFFDRTYFRKLTALSRFGHSRGRHGRNRF